VAIGNDSIYSNKISPADVAHITVYNGTIAAPSGTPVATVNATADIDGQWQTTAVTLPGSTTGPTTYFVFMQEFRASDTLFQNPVGTTSASP
jgi:hypothetical protein